MSEYLIQLMTFVATGFGVGYLPAPGTMATLLLGVPTALLWHWYVPRGMYWYVGMALAVMGAYVCIARALPTFSVEDPKEIVLDEVVGTVCACVLGPLTGTSYVVRVMLFRFFDITKLWPISASERLPGALGILADDCVAGIFAHLVALGIGL